MIFDKLVHEKRETTVNDWKEVYSFENGYDNTPMGLEMKESTYFSCIKIISESIAKCTLQVKIETDKGEDLAKKHYLYDMLRLRPNPYMNSIDTMKAFVSIAKHKGIAGLYINRTLQGAIEGLYPVEITQITVDNAGLLKSNLKNKILYDFKSVNNDYGACFDSDLIILKDFTLDGINTKAIKTIAKQSLDTSIKAQGYLNTLFTNGLTNRIVVQLTSDLKDEKELNKVQNKFSRIYSNNGKIFTVPAGYNVSALNLSLADAQFSELRKLSKEEIAMSFLVPLTKLGFVKENAKSEEQDNLKFLQDCLQIIFQTIEQEMDYKLFTEAERKLGYKVRFNINTLLRMDALTQSTVISKYVGNGVYSLNTAKKILGIKLLDEDVTTLPSGQVLLKDLMEGNLSYQKGGGNIDKGNKEPDTGI